MPPATAGNASRHGAPPQGGRAAILDLPTSPQAAFSREAARSWRCGNTSLFDRYGGGLKRYPVFRSSQPRPIAEACRRGGRCRWSLCRPCSAPASPIGGIVDPRRATPPSRPAALYRLATHPAKGYDRRLAIGTSGPLARHSRKEMPPRHGCVFAVCNDIVEHVDTPQRDSRMKSAVGTKPIRRSLGPHRSCAACGTITTTAIRRASGTSMPGSASRGCLLISVHAGSFKMMLGFKRCPACSVSAGESSMPGPRAGEVVRRGLPGA